MGFVYIVKVYMALSLMSRRRQLYSRLSTCEEFCRHAVASPLHLSVSVCFTYDDATVGIYHMVILSVSLFVVTVCFRKFHTMKVD